LTFVRDFLRRELFILEGAVKMKLSMNQKFLVRNFIVFFLGCLFTSPLFAQEQLGKLVVNDLTLRPQGYYLERQQGEFELGESSVGLLWELDDQLSSQFRIGAHSLRGKPRLYLDSKNGNDIDLVEAYGQYQGLLGRIRIGLIPLELGREGTLPESELIFPRSQIYSQGLFGLRDLGINYFINYNRFFTALTAFNGESDSNKDQKTWYGARWGYDFAKLRVEAFGQTGSTSPLSTTGSLLNVARFDPTKDSKWRMGGLYADWRPSNFVVSLEGVVGDMEQLAATHRFASATIDMGQIGGRGLGYFFRYNPFDPDVRRDNDAIHRISLAVVKANSSLTSKVILIGSKVMEEGGSQVANDEIRLIWSLTPLYFPPRN